MINIKIDVSITSTVLNQRIHKRLSNFSNENLRWLLNHLQVSSNMDLT